MDNIICIEFLIQKYPFLCVCVWNKRCKFDWHFCKQFSQTVIIWLQKGLVTFSLVISKWCAALSLSLNIILILCVNIRWNTLLEYLFFSFQAIHWNWGGIFYYYMAYFLSLSNRNFGIFHHLKFSMAINNYLSVKFWMYIKIVCFLNLNCVIRFTFAIIVLDGLFNNVIIPKILSIDT